MRHRMYTYYHIMIKALILFFSITGRQYRRHHCLYCDACTKNISRHLKLMHSKEREVEEMDCMNHKDAMKKMALLRLRGDHFFNVKVLAENSDLNNLIVARATGDWIGDKYGPCPTCLSWVKETNLKKHTSHCVGTHDKHSIPGIGTLIHNSRLLASKEDNILASPRLLKIIHNMRRGDVKELCKIDKLIIALGEEWLIKSFGNVVRSQNYTSDRMRSMARFLRKLQEITGEENSLLNYLTPFHFDNCVKAAVNLSSHSDDIFDVRNPSVALKLGHDIKRSAHTKEVIGIKQSDEQMKKDATNFLILMEKEWPTRVATTALRVLKERRFNRIPVIPSPDDIQSFKVFLDKEILNMDVNLITQDNFKYIAQLLQAKLTTYNRRRPLEVESVT